MNIFFILTDSICGYKRKDDKSLLPIYEELIKEKEGFYFSNCVSLFPSTLLSVLSIFTGRFPYYILPDFYSDLENFKLPTYIDDLKKRKYSIKSILCWKLGISWLKNILNPIIPKTGFVGDRQLEAQEIYKLFNEEIDKCNLKNNNFFYMHFRAGDPKMNLYVKKVIEKIKSKKIWNNSITIITSDHGYYDRNLYKKIKLLHFDDIHHASLHPATFIKLPKPITTAKPRTINKRIYLFDLFETIFDYLGIKTQIKKKQAISFKKLIEEDIDINKHRVVRTDAYTFFQSIKKTAIYQNEWKLIFENNTFKLMNLKQDKTEKNDLKYKYKRKYEELKKYYLNTEEEAYVYLKKILDIFFEKSYLKKLKRNNIFIPENQYPPKVVEYLTKNLSLNNNIVTDFNQYSKNNLVTILFFNRPCGYGIDKLQKKYKNKTKKFIIVNLKFKVLPKHYIKKYKGYLNFIKTSFFEKRKLILQRPIDTLIWTFYMPYYFNKFMKKYYYN